MPPWYEGAYEKHLKAKGQTKETVNFLYWAHLDAKAVKEEETQASPAEPPKSDEHAETDDQFFAFIDANRLPDSPSFLSTNKYAHLSREDQEEKEMVAHLDAFAHDVQTGPKLSQKQRKSK